jgi:hypothetical protein
MTTQPIYTVSIHADLVDTLDGCLAPQDGIAAIDNLFGELPTEHRSRSGKRSGKSPRRNVPLYRGRFAWIDIGFSYVEIDRTLHVVDLWTDAEWRKPGRREVDVVIGKSS